MRPASRGSSTSTTTPLYWPMLQRTLEEIASFFDGLELVEPGVVSCPRWRPDPALGDPPAELDAFGGVGRKP